MTSSIVAASSTIANQASSSSTSAISSGTILIPSATSNARPSAVPQSSSNHSLALGVGVGVPLGLLAVAVVAILFYRDQRNKKRLLDSQSKVSDPKGTTAKLEVPELGNVCGPNHELPTGLDRGELSTGKGGHELHGRQRYEIFGRTRYELQ